MRNKIPLWLPALLVVGLALAAVFSYVRSRQLSTENAALRAADRARQDSLRALDHLIAVDSLFHQGEYLAAAAGYDSLRKDSPAVISAEALDQRARHGRRLFAWSRELDTLRLAKDREPLPPPIALAASSPGAVVNPSLERAQPSQYDSLTFALRKARARIRSLEQRAQRRTADSFLRLKSGKGNDMYYVGDVLNGEAHGQGAALYSTGSRYVGQWRNNQKHGMGEFFWKDGARYVGEYYEDKRHGEGTYYFPDGEVYVGTWAADAREGEGIMYDAKGKVLVQGTWQDDELVE